MEALAFSALHLSSGNTFYVLPEEQIGFEKILMLIEKMSVSDGLKRMREKKGQEDKIKALGLAADKVDIMAPFRRKYQSYFELREREGALARSLKVGNAAFKQLIALTPTRPAKKVGSSLTQSAGNKADLFGLVLKH